jgi:hypothetical protein
MTRVVLLVAVIGLGLLASALPGDDAAEAARKRPRNVARTDTVVQSDYFNADVEYATISGDPFAFAKVGKIVRLTRITITATIVDGETGPGQSDENELTLELDGIDTGIKLNGFPDSQTVTRTVSGVPANREQILAALKADGKLEATIHDSAADGNYVSVPAAFSTTLTIKGKQKA